MQLDLVSPHFPSIILVPELIIGRKEPFCRTGPGPETSQIVSTRFYYNSNLFEEDIRDGSAESSILKEHSISTPICIYVLLLDSNHARDHDEFCSAR